MTMLYTGVGGLDSREGPVHILAVPEAAWKALCGADIIQARRDENARQSATCTACVGAL